LMLRAGGASMVYQFMAEDDITRILKHPMVAIASDSSLNVVGQGVPHPRGYGNAVRALGRYVREMHVISLEEAVRKMTSLPADQFGFADRGRIAPGKAADLVIFDAATVADAATYDRPHQYPVGISAVLVNGVLVVTKGAQTSARPGLVLTRATH
ncbi:MAG TPA: amidohydrolase family protein, partial [Vicinamibacterales bacterium]|nr:amidohydrolase family protein [Vicinamibacterales bacterium]